VVGQGRAGDAAAPAKFADRQAFGPGAYQMAQDIQALLGAESGKARRRDFDGQAGCAGGFVFHISRNIEINRRRKIYFDKSRNICIPDTSTYPARMNSLQTNLAACRLCADRFAATQTAHAPRPVVWFRAGARLRIVGQAPGLRVHQSGIPFDDRSGDRLRAWMGIDRALFYDRSRVAIVPMGFCFPGYDSGGADLPPPRICAETWQDRVQAALGEVPLTLLVGGYAQKWHLGTRAGVTATVRAWRDHAPRLFPLPHPSWRNTGWLKKNPWFEAELLPALRARIGEVLNA